MFKFRFKKKDDFLLAILLKHMYGVYLLQLVAT